MGTERIFHLPGLKYQKFRTHMEADWKLERKQRKESFITIDTPSHDPESIYINILFTQNKMYTQRGCRKLLELSAYTNQISVTNLFSPIRTSTRTFRS